MNKIQDNSAFLFIVCICILTAISIGGIWNFFEEDVVWKSFQSIGLLAFASAIVIGAGKYWTPGASDVSVEEMPVNPTFNVIKKLNIEILVVAVVALTFLGILSIWEVLGGDTLTKAFSTTGVLVFSTLIIIATCMSRVERKSSNTTVAGTSPAPQPGHRSLLSTIAIIAISIWIMGMLFRSIFVW